MKKVESIFSPLPVLKSNLMRSEITGLKLLSQLGRDIYGSDDPTRVYYDKKPQEIIKDGDGYVLILNLPFVKKAQLDILKNQEQ